jgi:peptidoglycan hydrolase-like protein with peptidoglycan-binding domain
MNKRILSLVGLFAAVALALVALAPKAQAATAEELQAQINALLAQIASLQGGSSVGCYAFTRDLTVGATGADVTALQNYLAAKGYFSVAATGYFGPITQASVSAWQSANGVMPAAGYFGPISRAKYNAMCGGVVVVPGDDDDDNSSDGLSGGEADLSDFDLVSEESSGNEGEEEVEVATAEFDVDDGDVRIERLELLASSTNDDLNDNPWDYFDRVSIWMDGEEVADMDVNDRDAWDEEDGDGADIHRLVLNDIDTIVEEGDRAEITIAFDIAGSIDTSDQDQEFVFQVPEDGIRAVDSEGIQQYIGASGDLPDNTNETVDFTFGAEESGDLDLESNTDDPDVTTLVSDDSSESEEYTVFVFDIDNNDSADALVTDLTFDVATSSGDAIQSILDSFTLSAGGDDFDCDINADGTVDCDDIDVEIAGDDTETFTVMVTLKEDAPESTIDVSLSAANVDAEGVDSGDDSDVSGSVSSETHVVSASGIQVEGTDKSTSVSEDGDTGTFTLEFTIEALEEDVYIYNGADDFAYASTTGVIYNIYKGGVIGAAATTTDSAVLQSSADTAGLGGAWFVVNSGETEDFTLTVSLNPDSASSALYSVELESVRFDDVADTTANDTDFVLPNDTEFETNAQQID